MKPYKAIFTIKGEQIDNHTENAVCPICGSDIRQRLALMFLKNNTYLFKSRIKLLHFAPEEGIYNFLKKQKNVEYIMCDINPTHYAKAIKIDITDIQFGDGSFDAFIAMHVLEHVKDDVRAMKELYRILKPDGWGLFAVPISGETTFEAGELDAVRRERIYGIAEHFRMYGLDFISKLSDAGFFVKTITVDEVPGKYIDRSVSSPHVESDKYLFLCKKA